MEGGVTNNDGLHIAFLPKGKCKLKTDKLLSSLCPQLLQQNLIEKR